MTETIAFVALAEKAITPVLIGLMSSLIKRVGKAVEEKAFPQDAIITMAGTAAASVKPFLLSLTYQLPADMSIAKIEKALGGFEAHEIIREMFYLQLAEPLSPLSKRLSDDLRYHLLRELGPDSDDIAAQAAILTQSSVAACARSFSSSVNAKYKNSGAFDLIVADNLLISTIRASRPLSNSRRRFSDPGAYRELVEWESAYRRQIGLDHGRIEPPDPETKRAIRIERLYVPARISPIAREAGPQSVTPLQLMARSDRVVILGDPGAGKTTAARYVSQAYAKNKHQRVPFTVTLRKFAEDGHIKQSVVAWIEKECETKYQGRPPKHAVDYLLASGRSLVIFDGLDELLDPTDRREVTSRVELFMNKYPSAQAMVTSRRVGYEQARLDPDTFETYSLGAFRDEDVAEYVRKWFDVVGGLQGDELARECKSFLAESRELPDLTRNPLMLALICILYKGQGYIPRNRSEVYEQCANLLFKKWDSGRHIHVELRAKSQVDSAIKHLAYWMLTDPDGTEAVTEAALVAEVSSYLKRAFEDADEREAAAKEFVDFCTGRAWVFSDAGTTANGARLFRFTHRTFMEYFAAYQLNRLHDIPEELAKELHPRIISDQWEVVGPLAVQIRNEHSESGADRILVKLLELSAGSGILQREKIHLFCWACLRSIVPTPATCKRLVSATVESSLDLISETEHNRFPISMNAIPESVPEIREAVAATLYESLLSAAQDRGRRASVARLALAQFPEPRLLYSISSDSRVEWPKIGRSFFNSHLSQIVKGAHAAEALRGAFVRDFFDMADFHGLCESIDIDPLEQLFLNTHCFDGGGEWTSWAYPIYRSMAHSAEGKRLWAAGSSYLEELKWVGSHYPPVADAYHRRFESVSDLLWQGVGDAVRGWHREVPSDAHWGVLLTLLPQLEGQILLDTRRRRRPTRLALLEGFYLRELIEQLGAEARAVCRAWVVGDLTFLRASTTDPQPIFDPF